MEIRERHRGRLIDHIGLVVRDLAASKAFYSAIFGVLKIPIGGSDERNFWADELFLATLDSEEVQGEPTGRHHLAFQAQDRAMVDAFHRAALAHGGRDNGAPGERNYTTRAMTQRLSWIRMVTISKRCFTVSPSGAQLRYESGIGDHCGWRIRSVVRRLRDASL